MMPADGKLVDGLNAAPRCFLAAALFGLLAACSGDPEAGPPTAVSAGSATPAAVAPKYLAQRYTATPVVAPTGTTIDLDSVRLSEGGHLGGVAFRSPYRSNVVYYWTAARGFTELSATGGHVADINDAGFVVGAMARWPGGAIPMTWSPASEELVELPFVGSRAEAVGVSNGATVIGMELVPEGSLRRPVFWRFDGTRHEIALPGPERTTFIAINRQGEAAGNYGNQPFVWTAASGITVLTLPADVTRAVTGSIGAGGHVVGYAEMADGRSRPFRWHAGTGFQIADVDLGSRADSYTFRVSEGGAVITTAQLNGRPIYWTADGGFVDLIGEAGVSGQAQSISADGTVVGWFKGADEIQRAFAWTPATGPIDLNTLLPPGLDLHLEVARQNTHGGHILAVANRNLILLAPAAAMPPPSQP